MQITVTFSKDQISLPIATSRIVQGLIYRALSTDRELSTAVHDEGSVFDKRRYKLLTFGELKGKYKAENGYITYFSNAELEIRSVDDYIIQLLFSYFSSNKSVMLGNNEVLVTNVRLTNKAVFDTKLEIRTLSPITVYITEQNGHTRYFSPEEDEFYSMLSTNAERKWKSMNNDGEFSFSIKKDDTCRFVKRATRFKDTFITAWHGRFIIEGSPKVLDFLYNVGLGGKNSPGFGMFERQEREGS